MNPKVLAIRQLLFASALILVAAIVGIFEYHHFVMLNQSNGWLRYSSTNAHLSFEYPSGWVIMADTTFSGNAFSGSSTSLSYASLEICPTGKNLDMEPKPGLNNCIAFATKSTLVYPPVVGDEFNSFYEFTPFIADTEDANYDQFHILSYDSSSPQTAVIGMLGFYRNQGDFVALEQPLCLQNPDSSCIASFQHVLDSIIFFPSY